MAKVKGARANKPNDSFGVTNNNELYRGKYRDEVYKDDEDQEEVEHEIVAANYTVPLSVDDSFGNSNIISEFGVAQVVEGALEIEMVQQEMTSDSAMLAGLETPVHDINEAHWRICSSWKKLNLLKYYTTQIKDKIIFIHQ